MTPRQLRLLRAASASSVATLLAAVSHTVAGGAAPHPLLVVAITALLVPLAALLIGARASRLRVALTVIVSQAAFHVVFQLLGSPTGGTMVGGHEHHLDLASFGPVLATAAPDTLMIWGHVAAAAATVLLLWHGESLIRMIAGWMLARLRRAIEGFRPAHERPLGLVLALPLLVDVSLSLTVSRRGPPALR